jgi:hypothetical protein
VAPPRAHRRALRGRARPSRSNLSLASGRPRSSAPGRVSERRRRPRSARLPRPIRRGPHVLPRGMPIHAEAPTTELFAGPGIKQTHLALLFNVGPRSLRRWARGDRTIPHGITLVLRLLAAGAVTVDQVEQAAVPARMNGSRPVGEDEVQGLWCLSRCSGQDR